MNVRKFSSVPLGPSDLLEHGSIGPRMLGFLASCVQGRMNIVISGGTSSGKTTLLGVLSSFVPPEERLITIEDAAEPRLAQPYVIGLEAQPATVGGQDDGVEIDHRLARWRGTHAPSLFSLSVHITHKHWAASLYGRRGRTLRENTVQRDLLAEAAERRQKWS